MLSSHWFPAPEPPVEVFQYVVMFGSGTSPVQSWYSHEVGSVSVDERAESQAVPEGRGHVGHGHVPVSLTLDPAPLLQSLHGRHPGAP